MSFFTESNVLNDIDKYFRVRGSLVQYEHQFRDSRASRGDRTHQIVAESTGQSQTSGKCQKAKSAKCAPTKRSS